ncbi:MAG TPA: hypothetical protein DCP57_02400 [Gammaproteobacteria bacterium]|nr:MAG: RnfABCDGE type electron transport complex subunit B [OM182 bacterium]HAL41268.1 hypothetical protein [Gammaproteobacteria bacterium]HBK19289.1 hypothetical protein [Gammaproteobacteria bacterium]|tara:strand:- start:2457 stop:3344 length:888 start_codon:yes stop_codon:yes gene_type:complete
MLATVTILALLLVLAAATLVLQRKLPADDDELVDAIDALLPQTQCAQCGHPGCRPYAQAVAQGGDIDLCPPGGTALVHQLADLMEVDVGAQTAATADIMVAKIDERSCIGCTLCLAPCPVDAIVGAQGYLHTIIADECTGCELCISPCPVDCITLHPVSPPEQPPKPERQGLGCINCGQCVPVCPKSLAPDQLLQLTQGRAMQAAHDLGLQDCIECSLCDKACPSKINLAELFGQAKIEDQLRVRDRDQRERSKRRFGDHVARLEARHQDAAERRRRRLLDRKLGSTRGDAQGGR